MKRKISVLLVFIICLVSFTGCKAVNEDGELNLSFVENILAQELGEETAKEIMDIIELAYEKQAQGENNQSGSTEQNGEEATAGTAAGTEATVGTTPSTAGTEAAVGTQPAESTEGEWGAEQGKPVEIDEDTFDETWPDCTYTRLVPKPGMGVKSAEVTETGLRVVFTDDTTLAQIREYVDQVIEAGFNNSVEIDPRVVDNMPRYKYTGYNAYGYLAEIYFSLFEKSLNISE